MEEKEETGLKDRWENMMTWENTGWLDKNKRLKGEVEEHYIAKDHKRRLEAYQRLREIETTNHLYELV